MVVTVVVVVATHNLAFGVLSKAAPALNPMQLGLPVSLL